MNGPYDFLERKLLIGHKKLQWLFEGLYRFSLRGMNYGQVHSIEDSGEVFVWKYLKNKFSDSENLKLFDVGANIGEYAKKLSAEFPKSLIYSFEVLPSTFKLLEENLSLVRNVICINTGLGAQQEQRLIFTDRPGSRLTSFYPLEQSHTTKIVAVTTLDEFCAKSNVNQIDFLKIDVEGFEMEVLKGAKRMIDSGKILNIQFEFGGNHLSSGVSFHDICQFLTNYKISRVLKNGLRFYNKYSKYLEVQLAANYLAELKT